MGARSLQVTSPTSHFGLVQIFHYHFIKVDQGTDLGTEGGSMRAGDSILRGENSSAVAPGSLPEIKAMGTATGLEENLNCTGSGASGCLCQRTGSWLRSSDLQGGPAMGLDRAGDEAEGPRSSAQLLGQPPTPGNSLSHAHTGPFPGPRNPGSWQRPLPQLLMPDAGGGGSGSAMKTVICTPYLDSPRVSCVPLRDKERGVGEQLPAPPPEGTPTPSPGATPGQALPPKALCEGGKRGHVTVPRKSAAPPTLAPGGAPGTELILTSPSPGPA